jgi:hypothetical protein
MVFETKDISCFNLSVLYLLRIDSALGQFYKKMFSFLLLTYVAIHLYVSYSMAKVQGSTVKRLALIKVKTLILTFANILFVESCDIRFNFHIGPCYPPPLSRVTLIIPRGVALDSVVSNPRG